MRRVVADVFTTLAGSFVGGSLAGILVQLLFERAIAIRRVVGERYAQERIEAIVELGKLLSRARREADAKKQEDEQRRIEVRKHIDSLPALPFFERVLAQAREHAAEQPVAQEPPKAEVPRARPCEDWTHDELDDFIYSGVLTPKQEELTAAFLDALDNAALFFSPEDHGQLGELVPKVVRGSSAAAYKMRRLLITAMTAVHRSGRLFGKAKAIVTRLDRRTRPR